MGFFDLNIPYLENPKSTPSQNQTLKQTRLKFIIRAMEFGYTGVAYNRTIKGVISDAHYCSIPLFTPSSLLKLLPQLAASAKFHRNLLGVTETAAFRQYTRLTVCVDSASQAMLLNGTNVVLKSYNIVAAKPLNQNSFDQACQFSDVDIISIDFTDKVPFRLKQPVIKAAIKRGVYFEIMYSGLIKDVQTRCQVISNAKMLVDWTSGKNIILTSATSSANELRGPYDIVNLASMLGMTMERAKAAVSKNCRNLIIKALQKRQYHNEAIKVEPLTACEQLNFTNLLSENWLNWDPISSGQGDLLLDDVAKCFIASSDNSKVKAIDFNTIVNNFPSNGLQLKDILPGATHMSESQNLGLSEVKVASVNAPMAESQERSSQFCDEARNTTNVEPLLSKSCNTGVGKIAADNFQLVPHSVLQSNECMEVANYEVDKLILQESYQTSSPVEVENDDLLMPSVEHLQSESELKDIIITDLSFKADSNSDREEFEKSTLNQSTEFEVLPNHVTLIKESVSVNVSQAQLLSGDSRQYDMQSQMCDLSGKVDIMQSEEGNDSSEHVNDVSVDDGDRMDSSVPSPDLLNFHKSDIEIPENIYTAIDMSLESDGTHQATASVLPIVLGGDDIETSVDTDLINCRELVEPCTEVKHGDGNSLNSEHHQTNVLMTDDLNHEDEEKQMDEVALGKHKGSKKSHRAAIFPLKRLLNHTNFKNKQRKLKPKAKKV